MEHLVNSPRALGEQLRAIRKGKGLSQGEAGGALKLAQSVISSIENGAPGTQIETLFRFLYVLELEMVIRPKRKIKDFEGEW